MDVGRGQANGKMDEERGRMVCAEEACLNNRKAKRKLYICDDYKDLNTRAYVVCLSSSNLHVFEREAVE